MTILVTELTKRVFYDSAYGVHILAAKIDQI